MGRHMLKNTLAAGLLTLVMGVATAQHALAQASPEPDEVIQYGDAASQRIEVFLPEGDRPAPVVVFISGGCYVKRFGGPAQVRPVLDELTRYGVAVWSVGYRRTDEEASFPDLFNDVAAGIDRIRSEAERLQLNLDRIVFVGHSAGGHLALWAAARDRLPQTSPLWRANPVRPTAVVGVAAPGDIEPLRAVSDGFCGEGVFDAVVGLPTATRTDVFEDTNPSRLLPLGLPIRLVDGSDDQVIPPPLMAMFESQAKAAGDEVTFELVPDADHIDVITSGEAGWGTVRHTVLSVLGLPLG